VDGAGRRDGIEHAVHRRKRPLGLLRMAGEVGLVDLHVTGVEVRDLSGEDPCEGVGQRGR